MKPPKCTTPMPMHSALTSAMMTAARKAPVIEPMPPTTTTTNASPITIEVEPQIGRLARHLQRAAEAGQEGAEREHDGEQQGLIDAERAHHLAILRGGADQAAEPGLGQHRDEGSSSTTGPIDDQEQVVARKVAAEDLDRAAQAGRARPEQVLGAPDALRHVVDDEHEREGGEQLEQLRRLIDAAQQQDLDQRAERRHHQRRQRDAAPEARARRRPWWRSCRRDRAPACRTSRGRC